MRSKVTLGCGLMLLLVLITWMAEAYGLQTVHPVTQAPVAVRSVLNAEGVRWLLRHGISNLYHYSTLGEVLLGLFSLGLAQHTGFLDAVTGSASLCRMKPRSMVMLVVVLGALSHFLGDVGYLLLLPLAASLFRRVGLPPVAGVMTAFAAIGCTAVHYALFLSLSGVVLLGVMGWVSCRQLPSWGCHSAVVTPPPLTRRERRALTSALTAGALYAGLLLWGCMAWGELFLGVDGTLTHSPLMEGIVPVVCLGVAWMAGVYGAVSGRYRVDTQLMEGAVSLIPLLRSYFLYLLFFAELQALLDYSQLGSYLAIEGATWVGSLTAPLPMMWLLVVLLSALLNLLIVPTEVKWQLLAPCLEPLIGCEQMRAEALYSAFCIGDCSTDILSPFLPYLPWVLAWVQYVEPQAGYRMLWRHGWRYSVAVLVVWSLLFLCWQAMGWPFVL